VFPNHFALRWRPWVVLLVAVAGCGTTAPADGTAAPAGDSFRATDPKALVPVGGIVTINGKPVETALVMFLPRTGAGIGTAETDKDGKYQMSTKGKPGALPGDYKVWISYVLSAEGEPPSRSARNSKAPPAGMQTAKGEFADDSNPGRGKLLATVGPNGGTFNFDLTVSIPAAAGEPAEKNAGEAKPDELKTLEKKK
jgi:hypothetical protein